jgi:hypothetical protein
VGRIATAVTVLSLAGSGVAGATTALYSHRHLRRPPAAIASILVSARAAMRAAQADLDQSFSGAAAARSTSATTPTSTVVVTTTTAAAGRAPTADPASDNDVPVFGPGTSFTADQRWVETALSDRQARLATLSGLISASSTLQSSDRTGLDGLVSAAQSACSSLQQSVPSDDSTGELQAAADEMIDSLHVYAILSPQVSETIGADAVTAAAAKLQALAPGLNTAIAAASANSRQMARLHELEQGLTAEADAASSLTTPLSAQLIGLSDANLSSAAPVLISALSSERVGLSDVTAADSDLRQLLALLAQA